ncbi:MAG: bile acid:sodium symporter [Halioglobus sp.]
MNYLLLVMLALMMFTMGLTLSTTDFAKVVQTPRAAIVGIFCQMMLLPAVGYLLCLIFSLSPAMTMGFMILCLSPGGVMSNYISYLARGDGALSISLTVISSLISVFSLPLMINWVQYSVGIDSTSMSLPVMQTIVFLASMTLIPVALGMLVRRFSSTLADKISSPLSALCSSLLLVYIVYVWSSRGEDIAISFAAVGPPVIALMIAISLLSFTIAKLAALPEHKVFTIVIEAGLQNSAMAFTITSVLLNDLSLGIPNMFYSMAMFVPALILVALGRRRALRRPQTLVHT